MLCQVCKKNPATIHYKELVGGIIKDMDICSECAKGKKNIPLEVNINMPISIQDLFSSLMEMDFEDHFSKQSEKTCPGCGSTYSRFKTTGRVGCHICYEAFKDNLYPLIRRIQGRVDHQGKIPSNASEELKIKKEVNSLKAQLREAIEKEDFESAAELRDKIRLLEKEVN